MNEIVRFDRHPFSFLFLLTLEFVRRRRQLQSVRTDGDDSKVEMGRYRLGRIAQALENHIDVFVFEPLQRRHYFCVFFVLFLVVSILFASFLSMIGCKQYQNS